MANFNLKSVFTADTEGLKKGAADAKAVVKDFDDSTTSALNEVTALFGTSMGDISRTLGSIKGGFLKLNLAINGTTQATSLSSKALKVFKIALASTGIGLLVVALGSLVAYFTKSQEGSNALSKVMGQLGQIVSTITDYFIKLGEAIVKAFKNPGEAVKKFWRILTNKEEREQFKKSIEGIGKDIEDRQKRRLVLTERQQALEKAMIDYTVEKATLQTEIEKQREIATDKANRTAAERLAANLKAQELTAQLYDKEKKFAQERLDILVEENSLSESMNKDLQAEADLKAELISLEGQRASRTKELLAQQAELTTQVKKEREELEKIAAYRAQGALQRVDGSGVLEGFKVETKQKSPVVFEETESMKYAKREAEYLKTLKEDAEKDLVDLGRIATDFSSAVADAFASMIEGLVSGDLNIKDIFGNLLEFLGTTLKQIGKALIAYGTAMEAFKKTFKSPWAAIAAGAALVAAGTVLTNLVNKASSASGASSAGSTYAAATVGGGSTLNLAGAPVYSGTAQEIRVTGTLKASGSQLVAVIENESKRKQLTT